MRVKMTNPLLRNVSVNRIVNLPFSAHVFLAPDLNAIKNRCVCCVTPQEKTGDGVVLMLLANKLDLADGRRMVAAAQGRRLAEVRLV